jgi:O-antigen ligase
MHPSYLSLYVSFSFVIVINDVIARYHSLSFRKKTIYYLWLVFLAFGVFYIRSRTGMVTFVILVLFIIVYRIPKTYRIILAAGFVTLLGLLYLSIHLTSFHKGRAQFDQVAHSIDLKKKQWEASTRVIEANFLWGVSAIKAQEELNKQYEQMGFQEGRDYSYNSHNQFLTTLLQEGLVGFLLLFTPFLLIFYQGIKRSDLIMVCFFILTSLTFLTESMLDRHKGIIYYALFLALLGFRMLPENPEKQLQDQ